ncbi:ubiquitin carboxyl-terminal hydrolase 19 isoform X2 [Ranitomeya imitator]|uniref:ubiquitin carboxyl-terminal hydrolase 19 isoform X2 n=1 Tax=Ranitomeya imitator TaxID=111125 RepID=UPI0037E8D41A
MSHPAEGTGQRRATRGTEDVINKKKQKDRVNQESKEGKMVSSTEPRKDMMIDWKQNSGEVIVKLNPGPGAVNVDELKSEFTDTDCVIHFPEGNRWNCHFHEEIEGSCSKIQYKEKGNVLQLILQKKIPMNKWPSLQKKKKDMMKEPAKPLAAKENGKTKSPLKLPAPDSNQSQPVGNLEIKRIKPDLRNVKRAQEAAAAEPRARSPLTRKSAPSPGTQVKKVSAHKLSPTVSARDVSPRSQKNANSEDSHKSPSGKEQNKCTDGIQAKDCPLTPKPARPKEGPQDVREEKVVIADAEKTPLPEAEHQPAAPAVQSMCCSVRVPGPQGDASLDRLMLSEKLSQLPPERSAGCQEELSVLPDDSEAIAESSHKEVAHEEATAGKPDNRLDDTSEDAEPYMNLTFVKNDHYEKGNDVVVVHVYVKEVCQPTSRVLFREQDFTLIFQTRDLNFLRLHPGCGPDTVFRWQVKLRNLIEPDLCRYSFTGIRIGITLQKKQCQRWGGLEAPAAQVGGAKVAMPASPAPLDKAQPGSNQHSLSSKEEPRAVEKEKPRVEDANLDKVSSRAAADHVPVKPEPLMTSPKPTCMVPPMTHSAMSSDSAQEEEEKRVCLPGFTGLVNLGNTCFMNSVIQSLSNTRELRDYFQDHSFESEINCNNPLGTGGRLAVSFAVLLRALWKGTHHAFQPSKLKAIVASKASQFTGYAQHDAQEFMAFLLDGLHEDLNRIQNKPYTETVDSDGRPDEEVADEAWLRHKMRNDSFVVDLFQGQYKSKLVCPVCAKVSITFDPFLYLPVPLPQKQKVLTVFYFAKEPHKKPIKFLVSIGKENSSAADVLESISQSVRVKTENLRLAEVVKNRLNRMFNPSCSVDLVSPTDQLFCFEVLSPELAKEHVIVLQVQQRPQVPSIPVTKCSACQKKQLSEEEKLKRCTRCYRAGYCNQVCQKTHWPEHKVSCRPENIGYPFLISVPESRLTYSRLAQLLEGYARYSVNVFQPPFLPGRTSPEQPPQPLSPEKPDAPSQPGCTSAEEASEDTRDPHSAQSGLLGPSPCPSLQPEIGDSKVQGKTCADRHSSVGTASGFSEQSPDTLKELDSGGEKETSYEKSVKPEAAVAGYQQSVESSSSHAALFYIILIDSSGREVKLEDKGDAVLDLSSEDCSLALVWKNNERMKEFVLVESKELECEDDPGSASEASRVGLFTLEQCLNLFTKPEVLAPEEAWYCPKCNQHREASKQLMLWRLPNILIIQLKRFSFRTFIWRDKINDLVDFPVRGLDLTTFCIGQKEDHQRPIYDLYAVINHYGGMIGGHYTAYARLPNEKNSQRSDVGWRLFDDSTVTTVDESQVVTRYAYVLFYRRRNSPVERPVRGHPADHRAETGASAEGAAGQASLIWQALEAEEEELHHEDLRRRHHRHHHHHHRATPTTHEPAHLQLLDYPDEARIRYLVLGTMAAIVAFFLNIFYPFMSQGR